MLLFLDDNIDLCRSVSRIFKFREIDGRCFQEWSEAKNALEQSPGVYKHALIDFGLTEGESGLDIVQWIRQHYPDIHCILTSGARHSPFFKEEPPFQTFLPKPFGIDELVSAIS